MKPMTANTRFAIAVVILGVLMTGPFILSTLLLWVELDATERSIMTHVLLPRVPMGATFTLLGFAAGVFVLRHLFRQYVRGLKGMAEQLRIMLAANRLFRVPVAGPPEVQDLARAANDLAQQRDELLTDVDARIAAAKSRVEEERGRLAVLMAELSLGVVMCNMDGLILLYNRRAQLLFRSRDRAGAGPIGLGRSVFTAFRRGQISHALDNLRRRLARGSLEPTTQFVVATRSGQLLRTRMAPVLAAETGPSGPAMSGYVLTIENITNIFEREAERDHLLSDLIVSARAALQGGDPAVAALQQKLDAAEQDLVAARRSRWPLDEVLAADLVAAVCRRIEADLGLATKTEAIDANLWVRADGFALIQALEFLAARLQLNYDIREVRFQLSELEGRVLFDLIWTDAVVSSDALYTWWLEPLQDDGDVNALCLRDVVDRHGGEIHLRRDKAAQRSFFRLAMPAVAAPDAGPARPAEESASRPEFYDFDLFQFSEQGIDLDRKLTDLAYSVFDTETTGLEPSAGDEIIQIGAVRIVNGRLLRQEFFDQLIDPGIPLKPEGIPIHGITEEMVKGQPAIGTVLPAFADFCSETVLVAHNAAFDMRFLQLKEQPTGIRFAQPVLDTLLLSQVIHPGQESHRLESIAERLGINVIGRHTALGDAFVTGEVFLKMVPLLSDMGIVTLRQALDAAAKTFYAKVKY